MSGQYGYQYETSARKLKTDYNTPKKKKVQAKKKSVATKGKSKTSNSKINKGKTNTNTKTNTKINIKTNTKINTNTNVNVNINTNNNSKIKNNFENDSKKLNREISRSKNSITLKAIMLFLILFVMIFRNAQISQTFSHIQGLKNKIAVLQKENDQLEINIQNSTNLQSIEQAAKEKLGMQKLTNKQTVQISLPKKDYTEPRIENVILENDESWFSKLMNLFK